MSQCALQAEAGSPCSIAFALGRGCLHGLPQAPCGRAPLPGTWAPPQIDCGTPTSTGRPGVKGPIRRPICGSHHHLHLQGCSPLGDLCPRLCLRQSPSASAGTLGVQRCRPPCSAPPSPAPGNTDGDEAGGFKCRLQSHSAPFTACPRGHPALRSFTPGKGPQSRATEGSPSFPHRGTAAQPEDGRAGPTAILYLGFKTIPPPLPV